MQTQKQTPINEVIRDFYDQQGSANQVDQQLWKMLVAAMSSRDFDHCSALERANMLCLYKSLSTLIHQLHAKTELPS